MKITIDTKEDNKDEIKKVIALLQNLLDEPVSNANIFESRDTPGMFNIFSSEPKSDFAESKTADDLLKESIRADESEEEKESDQSTNIETY